MHTQVLPDGNANAGASLHGRVAWITGASRGLGRAIAVGMARAGAAIAITARDEDQLRQLADELGGDVLVAPGAVNDPGGMRAVADRVQERFGRLDALVNMAGINPTVMRSEHLGDAAWQEIIDVNLTGTFYCCRAASQHMLAAGRGSIINVSSVHGSTGVARMCAYAASKGGVETLTKALAVEWADRGIRVNCLAPGYFRTELTEPYLASAHGSAVREHIPVGRFGEAGELVGASIFLASDAASYVTGSTIHVDGGWTAR